MMNKLILIFLVGCSFLLGCDPKEPITDITQFPGVKISDQEVDESAGTAEILVSLTWPYTQDITVTYEVVMEENESAEDGKDFISKQGELSIAAGDIEANILVDIIDDERSEPTEFFEVKLTKATLSKILDPVAKIKILDQDSELVIDDEGYNAPDSYPGYDLVWEEDFNNGIDPSIWTYEMGATGWGNNELQYYTDREENSYTQDGYLVIEALKESFQGSDYTSARMISQDKYEFAYGRVDIRAKVPEGQGLWPALWMLGDDFQDVGWPRCGEIDIMEIIGSQANICHGTAHYGNADGQHMFKGGSTFLPGGADFSKKFHVYSIVWSQNFIQWEVDNKVYFTLSPDDIGEGVWAFNHPFFFILNVAVGGNWPGNPDDTTLFPQRMIVDHIRVFQ